MAEEIVAVQEVLATVPGEYEIREEIRFIEPAERFQRWEQILKAVEDEFVRRTSGVDAAAKTKMRDELIYHQLVNDVLNTTGLSTSISPVDLPDLVKLLRAYQFGYGAIEDYMNIPDVEEVYFNDFEHGFYITGGGHKQRISRKIFANNKELEDMIRRAVTDNGVQINAERPNVDATMRDGSRLNSTLEPIAVDGPDLIIRKHREEAIPLEQLVADDTLSDEMVNDIAGWFRANMNIVVCGGTASGKTTLLNALGDRFIEDSERIIVIENRKELRIKTADIKYFQTRENPTKVDEEKDVTARDVIRYALRKRPKRIILGEIRGGEALDALTAWNSGHDGSLCTIHANSAWECVSKLAQLCGFSSARPSEASVRQLIAQSVDIIIYINEDSRTGRRSVEEVVQILHSRKHDYTDAKVDAWVKGLRESGYIQQERSGSDDILIAQLYDREPSSNQLRRIGATIPLRGRRIN